MSNQVEIVVNQAAVPTVVELLAPGPQGPPGAAGATGPAGVGAAWQQGAGAPSAGTGSNGDFYLNTTNGDIYGPKTAGAWGGVIFNIAEGQQGPAGPAGAAGAPGAQGPAGADGRTLLSGTTAPGAGVGANGDFFINTAASLIYGPKAGGVWPTGVSLVGPAGATGPAGPAGATGSSAYQVAVAGGFVGTEAQWLASLVGAQGPQGPAGATGPQGPAGPAGATGPQGPAGVVAATAPITYDAGTQTVGISAATTSAAGSMSATDKAKLDGIEPGAQVNVATDLSYDAATREVRSSTGVDAPLPLVSTSLAGLAPATSFAALTYGATTALDFSAIDGQARTITLTGNLELTTSNLAAGRTVVLRLLPGASQRTLTFPVDWVFIGSKPANIAASKTAVLSLTAFGTTNADVVAAYAVQS